MKLRYKRKVHNLPRLYRSIRILLLRTFNKALTKKEISTYPVGIKFNFDPKARARVKELLRRILIVEKKIKRIKK